MDRTSGCATVPIVIQVPTDVTVAVVIVDDSLLGVVVPDGRAQVCLNLVTAIHRMQVPGVELLHLCHGVYHAIYNVFPVESFIITQKWLQLFHLLDLVLSISTAFRRKRFPLSCLPLAYGVGRGDAFNVRSGCFKKTRFSSETYRNR
jgi:hypothetical protein